MEEKLQFPNEGFNLFGLLLLSFIFANANVEIPKEIKTIIEKYIQEDGSVLEEDKDKMAEELKSIISKYYDELKEGIVSKLATNS